MRKAYYLLILTVLVAVGVIRFPVQPASAQTSPACQSASGLSRFGVNEVLGWPGLYPPERLERSLGLMAEAGIGWARLNWAWKDLQPQEGPFDYTHLDAVARIAAEH